MGRYRIAGMVCLKYILLPGVTGLEYDEAALYTLQKYFETLFDIPRLLAKKSFSGQSHI